MNVDECSLVPYGPVRVEKSGKLDRLEVPMFSGMRREGSHEQVIIKSLQIPVRLWR